MRFQTPAELYARYLEHPRVRIDSRKVGPGDFFVALAGTRVHGNFYAQSALDAGAAYALVDDAGVIPENDDRYLLVDNTLLALQQLARTHRNQRTWPVLAITGSNGKTTTKELIKAVMSRRYSVHATPGNYNNHIGLPLTILGAAPETEFLLIEMGANHQGEIAELCTIGQPSHGLITNIGDAHLEGFGGKAGIIAGKGELFDYLATHRGVTFVNANEDHLADMLHDDQRVVWFEDSEAPSGEVANLEIRSDALSPTIKVAFLGSPDALYTAEVQLNGRHNLQNVKAAVAVGKYFKVPGADIAAALTAYRPDNHRSQHLTHRGVDFYWDAYNANPTSVEAALAGFALEHSPSHSVVILGEMLELGPEAPAAHRRVVLRAGQVATTVLLVGEAMRAVADEFNRPWFEDSEALANYFWSRDWAGRMVFVKGSRGNKLERLLDGVREV